LYNNDFGPADVQSMSLKVRVREGDPKAQISEIYLDRSKAYPGDTVGVDVYLNPFTGPKFKEHFDLVLPDFKENTRLFMLIGSGDLLTRTEFQITPARFRYNSLKDLVRLINASRKENYLYLKLFRQDRGLMVNGKELTGLPSSVWSMLKADNTATSLSPLSDYTVSEMERPTGYVIDGFKMLQIEVMTRP
jgi:hypothetical protein